MHTARSKYVYCSARHLSIYWAFHSLSASVMVYQLRSFGGACLRKDRRARGLSGDIAVRLEGRGWKVVGEPLARDKGLAPVKGDGEGRVSTCGTPPRVSQPGQGWGGSSKRSPTSCTGHPTLSPWLGAAGGDGGVAVSSEKQQRGPPATVSPQQELRRMHFHGHHRWSVGPAVTS